MNISSTAAGDTAALGQAVYLESARRPFSVKIPNVSVRRTKAKHYNPCRHAIIASSLSCPCAQSHLQCDQGLLTCLFQKPHDGVLERCQLDFLHVTRSGFVRGAHVLTYCCIDEHGRFSNPQRVVVGTTHHLNRCIIRRPTNAIMPILAIDNRSLLRSKTKSSPPLRVSHVVRACQASVLDSIGSSSELFSSIHVGQSVRAGPGLRTLLNSERAATVKATRASSDNTVLPRWHSQRHCVPP